MATELWKEEDRVWVWPEQWYLLRPGCEPVKMLSSRVPVLGEVCALDGQRWRVAMVVWELRFAMPGDKTWPISRASVTVLPV